jgi:membrane protease YdiL (CAAX protease family)
MDQLVCDVNFKVIYSISLTLAAYYLYYFPAFSEKTKIWVKSRSAVERFETNLFMLQKFYGFLMLGLIPWLLFHPFIKITTLGHVPVSFLPVNALWVMALLVPIIVILIYFSARKSNVYSRFPVIRLREWGIADIVTSISGWGFYLLGYEYLFRELLLFTMAESLGVPLAIAVNVALYSSFHLPNGKNETLGAIPFGLVLCLVSFQTGSFVMAFLLHFTLSVSSEVFSIIHNPEMSFKLKKH